jgi:tetratricopeptide (TPR) repeat protein
MAAGRAAIIRRPGTISRVSRARRRPPPPIARPEPVVWYAAALVVAGLLVYANSFGGPFLFDDFGSIVRNTSIRDLTNLRALFTTADATAVSGRWLANLSYALNYAAGGLNVTGYHVVNLALHLACAVLFFAVVRRTLDAAGWSTADRRPGISSVELAFAIALVWTVHPLISEVVLYLSERTESMMTICYMLTLYSSVRAAGSPHAARWLSLGVISCVAGVLCKEVMVTAPFTVVVYDRVYLFSSLRDAFQARWRFYAGLALTWVILAGSMLSHGSISSGGFQSAQTTTWTYVMNQTVIVTRYLRLVVWPRPLVLYYGWTRALALADVWPYAVFLVMLIIAAAIVFFRWPRYGFAAAWTIITLSPSSSLAKIAAEVGAERRMYLPLMGIVTLAIVGAALLLRARASESPARGAPSSSGRVLLGAAVAIAMVLGTSTFLRARDYSSSLAMARTILAGWESPSAHQLLGQELAAAGQRDDAIAELRRALPEATPARYFLGTELVNAGQYDEGIDQLHEFIRLEPTIAPVKTARMLLARAYVATQRWPEAVAELNAIASADPDDRTVQGVLANVLAGQQKFADAVPHYEAYIKATPRDANAWTGLGVALISLGKREEALSAFRQAVTIDPGNAPFRLNLARILLNTGSAAEAASEAAAAIAIAPNEPAGYEVLGRVLAIQGKRDEARRSLERALQIDPSYAPARDALRAIGR